MLNQITKNVEYAKQQRCKKFKVGMDCNTIEWLVDLLGTIDLLQTVITPASRKERYAIVDLKDKNTSSDTRDAFRARGEVDVPDGLYFDGAHWFSVKNKEKKDAYGARYQIIGTAHFCQTFAAMIFTEKVSALKKREWAGNIKAAIDFWLDEFRDQPIKNYFLEEVRNSEYRAQSFYESETLLGAITGDELFGFLNKFKENAHDFTGCMQG